MPADDGFAMLAAEYRGMTPRARRAVLNLLDPAERQELERISTKQTAEALSPWLAERCREVRQGVGPLAAATREALSSLDLDPAASVPPPRGPSLAGRVSSLIGGLL